jgi:hypothetical protein
MTEADAINAADAQRRAELAAQAKANEAALFEEV